MFFLAKNIKELVSLVVIDFSIFVSLLILLSNFGYLVAQSILTWIFGWSIMFFLIPVKGIPYYLKIILKWAGLASFLIIASAEYFVPFIFEYLRSAHMGPFPLFDIAGFSSGALPILASKSN